MHILKATCGVSYLALALIALSSCSDHVEEPSIEQSANEITFTTTDWVSVSGSESRTSSFGKNDLQDPSKGGGNFTVSAYLTGAETPYFTNERVWFFKDLNRWTFLNAAGEPMTYYWPNTSNLNFFAYMPNAAYNGKNGYVSADASYLTLGTYSEADGQTFSCAMPEQVTRDTQIHEFIYSYVPNRSMNDGTQVKLHFDHPFALIDFKMGVDSYRLTINSIKLNGIYLDGKYSTVSKVWTPTAAPKSYTMGIGLRIPNDLNYNTSLSRGGFLVMPQNNEQMTLTIDFTRRLVDSSQPEEAETITVNFPVNWIGGNKYTYSLRIGSNKDEIYYDVVVDKLWDWIETGETNIDVE